MPTSQIQVSRRDAPASRFVGLDDDAAWVELEHVTDVDTGTYCPEKAVQQLLEKARRDRLHGRQILVSLLRGPRVSRIARGLPTEEGAGGWLVRSRRGDTKRRVWAQHARARPPPPISAGIASRSAAMMTHTDTDS